MNEEKILLRMKSWKHKVILFIVVLLGIGVCQVSCHKTRNNN
jgi:hypothetical protein